MAAVKKFKDLLPALQRVQQRMRAGERAEDATLAEGLTVAQYYYYSNRYSLEDVDAGVRSTQADTETMTTPRVIKEELSIATDSRQTPGELQTPSPSPGPLRIRALVGYGVRYELPGDGTLEICPINNFDCRVQVHDLDAFIAELKAVARVIQNEGSVL